MRWHYLRCSSALAIRSISFNKIEDYVRMDAAPKSGSSSGAIFNADGLIIDIMIFFVKNSDTNVGVNFPDSSALIFRTVGDFVEL